MGRSNKDDRQKARVVMLYSEHNAQTSLREDRDAKQRKTHSLSPSQFSDSSQLASSARERLPLRLQNWCSGALLHCCSHLAEAASDDLSEMPCSSESEQT